MLLIEFCLEIRSAVATIAIAISVSSSTVVELTTLDYRVDYIVDCYFYIYHYFVGLVTYCDYERFLVGWADLMGVETAVGCFLKRFLLMSTANF